MMLCQLCRSIDLDQLTSTAGLNHHASFSNLCRSAIEGCEFCSMIRDSQETAVLAESWNPDSQIVATSRWQSDGKLGPIIRFNQKAKTERQRPFFWGSCMMTTTDDDLLAPKIERRPIMSDPAPAECFELASKWLSTCLETHADCSFNRYELPYLPARVIDIGPTADSIPYLYVTQGERGHWVTLSHCWGNVQPLKTTIKSLRTHQEKLPPLPRLFQDATYITRQLKQRYLWIDSLCIVQDSIHDWRVESSHMGYIYKNSFLTIGAYTTADSTESILDSSKTIRQAYSPGVRVPCHSSIHSIKGSIIFRKGSYIENDSLGPLSMRAWALQEDVLSARVIKWTKQQIHWQCLTTYCTEERPTGVSLVNGLSHGRYICLPPETLAHRRKQAIDQKASNWFLYAPALWYDMVQNFASRNITFETDKFAAISGVAKEVAKHTAWDYRAGIWLQNIHYGLLWYFPHYGSKSSTYLGPSWSWASINNHHCQSGKEKRGSLLYPYPGRDLEHLITNISKILFVEVTTISTDPFSQVTSGHLVCTGPCHAIQDWRQARFLEAQPSGKRNSTFRNKDVPKGTVLYCLDLEPSPATASLPEGAVIMQIASLAQYPLSSSNGQIYALVLARTGNSTNEYRRIGLSRISDDLITGWKTETITIV